MNRVDRGIPVTRRTALAGLAALGLLLAATPGPAADAVRGRTLYETRCVGCHDRSVHGRSERTAKTFDEIRLQVQRWDRELGASWTPIDVDDVSRYLNERYYRLPCPVEVCGRDKAAVDPAQLSAAR